MKNRTPPTLRLIEVPPLTKAESATLVRRVAAARARNGGHATDPAIPETLPVGATVVHGPARRGRPRQTEDGSQPVTLRMPLQVISYFKRGGRGWQTRVVAVLTKAAKLDK